MCAPLSHPSMLMYSRRRERERQRNNYLELHNKPPTATDKCGDIWGSRQRAPRLAASRVGAALSCKSRWARIFFVCSHLPILRVLVRRDPDVGLETVGAALDYKSRLTSFSLQRVHRSRLKCFSLRRVHRKDLGAGKVNAG